METEEVTMSPHLTHLVYLLHFTAKTILKRMGVGGGGEEVPNCHVQNAASQVYKPLKRGEINDAG